MNIKIIFIAGLLVFSKTIFANDSLITTQIYLKLETLEQDSFDVEITLFDSYLGNGYRLFHTFSNLKNGASISLTLPEISMGMLIIKKGEQFLSNSGSVVFGGDTLYAQPDSSKAVIIVKGGENEFMQENFMLPFNLPSKITSNKSFKSKMVQRAYDLEIPENFMFQTMYSEYLRNVLSLVKQHSNSFNILRLLNDNSANITLKVLDTALTIFNERIINTVQGRRLKSIITNGKWLINKPDLTVVKLENIIGKEKSLASLIDSTKFTFIDFWTSWCVPCRAFNTSLAKKYDSLNTNKIQIISISIDEDIENWKTALAKDKLPWLNYIDPSLRGFNGVLASLFNIQFIPQSFLFNKNGEIVNMNISIAELLSLGIEL